jgi:hypothetical protein
MGQTGFVADSSCLDFWPEILVAILTLAVVGWCNWLAWRAGQPKEPEPPDQIRGVWQ